jgi:hypothetical protein
MTTGWKIVTVLPNPSGASPLQEWSLVAIPDKGEAIRAIKARHPHAAIRVDSEADAELNWPPFRPDTRHNLEGLRLSSSTGLCLTTTNVSN